MHEKVVYMRACVISLLERKCVEAFVANEQKLLDGTLEGCLIDHISPLEREAYHRCETVSRQKIYNSKPVLDVELSGYNIMETLLTALVEAAMEPQRYYSRQLIQRFSSQYDTCPGDLREAARGLNDEVVAVMADLTRRRFGSLEPLELVRIAVQQTTYGLACSGVTHGPPVELQPSELATAISIPNESAK